MKYKVREDGSVPILYCERQNKWLPFTEHLQCEYCAAPVYDERDEPVSFLCTYQGEKREVQEGYEDVAEEGRGAPSKTEE